MWAAWLEKGGFGAGTVRMTVLDVTPQNNDEIKKNYIKCSTIKQFPPFPTKMCIFTNSTK